VVGKTTTPTSKGRRRVCYVKSLEIENRPKHAPLPASRRAKGDEDVGAPSCFSISLDAQSTLYWFLCQVGQCYVACMGLELP